MLTHAHSEIVQASPGHSSQIRHQNALTERAWKDAVQGLGNTNISIAAFKVKSRLNRSVPLFVRHEWQLCSTDQQGKSYPKIIPSPFITVICFCEEGMIQSFHKSHAKKPESGPLSDWIGKNMVDLRCSDWPKCRHPLVVVDFSLHLCLHNEQ